MSQQLSPRTGRRYPLILVCQVWRVARSSVYASSSPAAAGEEDGARTVGKRGPRTPLSDAERVDRIRGVLARRHFTARGTGKSGRGGATGRLASWWASGGCCG